MTELLNDTEHWQIRGLLASMGETAAADHLGVTYAEICAAIWPGTSSDVMAKIRERLAMARKVVPLAKSMHSTSTKATRKRGKRADV